MKAQYVESLRFFLVSTMLVSVYRWSIVLLLLRKPFCSSTLLSFSSHHELILVFRTEHYNLYMDDASAMHLYDIGSLVPQRWNYQFFKTYIKYNRQKGYGRVIEQNINRNGIDVTCIASFGVISVEVCVPFPQDVEFDCTGTWSLHFHLLYARSHCIHGGVPA